MRLRRGYLTNRRCADSVTAVATGTRPTVSSALEDVELRWPRTASTSTHRLHGAWRTLTAGRRWHREADGLAEHRQQPAVEGARRASGGRSVCNALPRATVGHPRR